MILSFQNCEFLKIVFCSNAWNFFVCEVGKTLAKNFDMSDHHIENE